MSAVLRTAPAIALKVLVRATDPARRELLRRLVVDAGHLPVDSPSAADAVLSDRLPAEGFASMPEPSPLFTPREVEVLAAIGAGLTSKMIARRLAISPHTVKFHVESLLRKLGARTRAEAVAKAREQTLRNTVEF
ncbi:MAG TPA: helix-turn-helix transcriptional regulator [Burkholderiales bacterium]|jgi:DNA-binding NarL/FixJ family response regulator